MRGCLNDASWVWSEPVRATAMEFERLSSAASIWHAEQTRRILKYRMFMRNKATLELLRQTNPTSLCVVLTWCWCFGDGQHAQFNPTAATMHQGVRFYLLGVPSLRVSVSPVSFSGCSYVPARSACLLRLTAAGASRCSCTTRPPVETERPWCALMRSPSLQPSSAPPPLSTKTCPRLIEYVGSRASK